jgi:predicted DNA-binding transcriptional regulator AlpA
MAPTVRQALLNISQVADRLGITAKAAYGRLHRGSPFPPPIRIGASLRWRPEDVDRWLDAHLDDAVEGGGRG